MYQALESAMNSKSNGNGWTASGPTTHASTQYQDRPPTQTPPISSPDIVHDVMGWKTPQPQPAYIGKDWMPPQGGGQTREQMGAYQPQGASYANDMALGNNFTGSISQSKWQDLHGQRDDLNTNDQLKYDFGVGQGWTPSRAGREPRGQGNVSALDVIGNNYPQLRGAMDSRGQGREQRRGQGNQAPADSQFQWSGMDPGPDQFGVNTQSPFGASTWAPFSGNVGDLWSGINQKGNEWQPPSSPWANWSY